MTYLRAVLVLSFSDQYSRLAMQNEYQGRPRDTALKRWAAVLIGGVSALRSVLQRTEFTDNICESTPKSKRLAIGRFL